MQYQCSFNELHFFKYISLNRTDYSFFIQKLKNLSFFSTKCNFLVKINLILAYVSATAFFCVKLFTACNPYASPHWKTFLVLI